MAVLANRVQVTTSTTGTGTITLGSNVVNYQTFAEGGVSDGDVVRYLIQDGNDWEVGTGTYTASGTTLSRTVSESSNSDAALNLSGSAIVSIVAAAEDITSDVAITGGTIDGTTIGGTTAAAITGTTGQFNTSLNVTGTITADGLTVDSSSPLFSGSNVYLTIQDTTAGGSAGIKFKKSTGDETGRIAINDGDDIGFYTTSSVTKRMLIDGDTGDISFYDDAGSSQDLYWDASASSLGIGTTSPSANLHVSGTIKLDGSYPNGTYNTALGASALNSVTTGGNYNVAIGRSAGESITTGDYNVAIGPFSLDATTTGVGNIAIGYSSLSENTSNYNIGIGYAALNANTTPGSQIAIGYTALNSNTTGANNIAIGREALRFNTTGANNNAFGYQALKTNTTGVYNTALGSYSLFDNTTGSYNTAIGMNALANNTIADGNIAVGYDSLKLSTTGAANIAMGYRSAFNSTTANNNVTIGYFSGYSITTGSANVALGRDTLRATSTGIQNVAIGYSALYDNTANYITAVGASSLANNTTGADNTALGYSSLVTNTTGSSNTGLGFNALRNNSTTSGSTAVGYRAGYYSTGSYNTFLGSDAGYLITTGSNNTIVGPYSGNAGGLDIRTSSNYIVLSDGSGNLRQVIDDSGNVGIGTASPSAPLQVQGSAGEVRLQRPTSTQADWSLKLPSSGGEFTFYDNNNTAERMRIDNSGNLLVGTTSTSIATANSGFGFFYDADGGLKVTRQAGTSSNPVLILNNSSTAVDSEILRFNKAGTTVGSIGNHGTKPYISSTGHGLYFGSTATLPTNGSGTPVDNNYDFGVSSYRWKDLYLSGTLTNDGTGGISIDTSGNVGIGTTAPATYGGLTLVQSANTSSKGLAIVDSTSAQSAKLWTDATNAYLSSGNTGADPLILNAGGGNVGIGNTSPDGNLTVGDTSTSGDISIRIKGDATSRGFLMFGDTGGAQLGDIMYDHSDNHMRFRVNNAERMRIDSSGNLLVGKTSDSFSTQGQVFAAGGYTDLTRAGTVLNLNRLTTDGDIAIFYKDGTAVGSIGSAGSGVRPYFAGDNVGLSPYNSVVYPTNGSGSAVNNSVDLGANGYAFKDLYLSGTLTNDGTGGITVDTDGNVGINNSSPSWPLDFYVADTVGNDTFYAARFDIDMSGSDTLTADRSHVGLQIDIDSSATGGDISNEHRIYGILTDVDVTGDSDLVYAHYAASTTNNDVGTQISINTAMYGYASNTGTVNTANLYGGYFQGVSLGQANNSIRGVYTRAYVQSGHTNTGDVDLYGLYTEVDTQVSAGLTGLTNGFGVYSTIDDNDSSITNAYLYYGDFQGTNSTTNWGIYVNDEDKNYFSGVVGIGTTAPLGTLDVTGLDGGNGNLYVQRTSGASLRAQAQSALGTFGTTSNHNLQLITNGSGRVTIATDGDVGIGTTSPAFRLHAYHATSNVVARFESGDSQVWIDLHDSSSGTYGALLGHDSGNLFMVADASATPVLTLSSTGILAVSEVATPLVDTTTIEIGSTVTLTESTDRADLLHINSSTSTYGGLQIANTSNEVLGSFMGQGTLVGLYDDQNGDWWVQMDENGGVRLYYNGTTKLETTNTTISLSDNLDMNNHDIVGVDQIMHEGDTDTYIQFHAADQWRVVTGGTERLEVNNTRTQIDNLEMGGTLTGGKIAPVMTGTITTAPVGAYGAFYANYPATTSFQDPFVNTYNAATQNLRCYYYNGSYVYTTVNYGTWRFVGRDYAGYGVLLQRIS
jgi:hypothetical protein